MEGKQRLRFGVMCRGTAFPAWQARCLQALLALDGVEPALLIVEAASKAQPPLWRRFLSRLRRGGLFWMVYSRLCVEPRSAAMRLVDLSEALSHLPRLPCQVVRKGKFSEYFLPADLDEIRRRDLDFVLRFAFNVIRGEILEVPRYGVWSFHHDDVDRYRGSPPGFWEIYKGDPVTGAILQRLTDRLDGGVVLKRGFFKTHPYSYVRNRDASHLGSAHWPAQVCRDIQRGRAGYLEEAPSATTAAIFRRPNTWQMLRFVFTIGWTSIASQMESLFAGEDWNVGIVDQPIQAFLDPRRRPPVRWLPRPPRGRFLADPFGIRQGTGLTVLVEDYSYRTEKGRIVALQSRNDTFSPPRPVLELPVHMSYPYLIAHGGQIYCVPETFEAREVGLYRAERFPEAWRKVATLVKDFAALDATVFEHDGRWWLFCVDHDSASEASLHAWHAPDLFGPWSPHPGNPLKTDIRSSRPAGTPFLHEGQLYRPAQDGSRAYGGSVVLNRVLRLTPEDFHEEPVARVEPDAHGPYPDGLHTLCGVGDLTIVDGKRHVFIAQAFQHALRRKLRKLGSGRAAPRCSSVGGGLRE